MECKIRKWKIDDAAELAATLNNKNIQDNLRDGLPYPYTEDDAKYYINEMLKADKNSIFAFAITADDKVVGSIGVFRKENIHSLTAEIGYYIAEPFGAKAWEPALSNRPASMFLVTLISSVFLQSRLAIISLPAGFLKKADSKTKEHSEVMQSRTDRFWI